MISAFVLLAIALLPLGLGVSNLRYFRPPLRAALPPVVSVLIPARNEERNIGKAVQSVLRSTNADFEIVVMDDGSTDRTLEILSKIDDHRLRVERAPPLPEGWCGKQHACASLAMVAHYDLLLFMDADVRLSPDALSRICGFMQRNDFALASGFPSQIGGNVLGFLLTPLIHFLLLGFLPMGRANKSLSPSLAAGCGQLMIARRSAYRETTGHAMIPTSMHDGLTLPRAFRRKGFNTGIFDASRIAKCRMYESAGALWEGFSKNATEGMATPLALPIWTFLLVVGQIFPLILLITRHDLAAGLALAGSYAFRVILARKLRFGMLSVPFHPLAVAILLVLQWQALIRWGFGMSANWRGRDYPTAEA